MDFLPDWLFHYGWLNPVSDDSHLVDDERFLLEVLHRGPSGMKRLLQSKHVSGFALLIRRKTERKTRNL